MTWPTRDAFLQAIHPVGYHDLRAHHRIAGKTIVKAMANIAADDFDGANRFTNTNASKWDIYTGVATRDAVGRSLDHCVELHTLFADVDFDKPSEEVAKARLTAFPLHPSIIVSSGGGLHCYWLLRLPLNPRLPQTKATIQALARALGSDPRSVDASHILRVPNTQNFKYSPTRPVELRYFNRETVYTLEEITDVIGPIPEPVVVENTPSVLNLEPKEKIRQAREFLVRQKPAIEGAGGDAHTYNVCCFMVSGFDLTADESLIALAKWNARCEPPWTEQDLREKIRNAERYKRGTIGTLLQPERRRIVVRDGQLNQILVAAEDSLLGMPIYNRGSALMRPIIIDKPIDDIRRQEGTIALVTVKESWLVQQLALTGRWIQKTAKGPKHIDPPMRYAKHLLEMGEWRFPTLRAIVTAPTLDSDGRIIERPGFDLASGLLLNFPDGLFPDIPLRPTKDDALRALQLLAEPLRSFPFVSDAAKSVALSAMLTSLVRGSLRTAPLHGYDAPTAGTGKSMLAESVGLLATGFRPPALSYTDHEDENLKMLSTVLFAGDPVIHLDNCDHEVTGRFLCMILTQETVQARILGYSERRVLPSTALLLASGNNLTFAEDVARRAIICRLDAKMERPDTRQFGFDVHEEIRLARPELVVAGLTVLRAYTESGGPITLQPMGSFNDWEWIRGALVWLGVADPAETRKDVIENDPAKNDLMEIMDLWAVGFGINSFVEVGDIDKRAEESMANAEGPKEILARESVILLRNRLIDMCCTYGKWSAKKVGWWLRRNKGRVIGDRSFESRTARDKQQWALEAKKEELELT